MQLSLRPLRPADLNGLRTWRYPPPYDVYDPAVDGDDIAAGDRWFAVIDTSDGLVGFVEFEVLGDEVEIGLGLRPDLTGRGLGGELIAAALGFAQTRWSPSRFALEVLPWNERAISAYEKAGFARGEIYTRRFDNGVERRFLRMSRPAAQGER